MSKPKFDEEPSAVGHEHHTGGLEAGCHRLLRPLEVLECEFSVQLRLCTILENIADGLPHDYRACDVREALPLVKRGQRYHIFLEEQHLFPMLRQRARVEDELEPVLAQAEHEHQIDQGLCHELCECVELLLERNEVCNPEMLGYLLRIHFETQRRHIAWERNVIFPLARRRLTGDDNQRLSRLMADPKSLEAHLRV